MNNVAYKSFVHISSYYLKESSKILITTEITDTINSQDSHVCFVFVKSLFQKGIKKFTTTEQE